MRWVIDCNWEDETIFVRLSRKDFSYLWNHYYDKGVWFQKKEEFHVTVFGWKHFFSQRSSRVKSEISQILELYQWWVMKDIEVESSLYHIQKETKHSLVSRVYSQELETLIWEILEKTRVILTKMKRPFLHTSLYTNPDFPRGIWLPTLQDFWSLRV